MALDATLRESILRLSPEEKAEVLRLIDDLDRAEASQAPKLTMAQWLEQARAVREMMAEDGGRIDAVAEVRAIRDEN